MAALYPSLFHPLACVPFGRAVLLFLLGIKNTLKHDFATAKRRRPHSGPTNMNNNCLFTWHLYVKEMIDNAKPPMSQ